MLQAPRISHSENALNGNWQSFSPTPEAYYQAICKKFKKTSRYTASQTWSLVNKLEKYQHTAENAISKKAQSQIIPEKIALYRTFLSALLKQIELIDDSYGEIGAFYENILGKYLQLDWRQNIDCRSYCTDLQRFIIWEDYGMSDSNYANLFKGISTEELSVVEEILEDEYNKLLKHELSYQAEVALTLLSYLYYTAKTFDKFCQAATKMGARHWERITNLAELAEKSQKNQLAIAVYEAATKNKNEMHWDFLQRKLQELQKRIQD